MALLFWLAGQSCQTCGQAPSLSEIVTGDLAKACSNMLDEDPEAAKHVPADDWAICWGGHGRPDSVQSICSVNSPMIKVPTAKSPYKLAAQEKVCSTPERCFKIDAQSDTSGEVEAERNNRDPDRDRSAEAEERRITAEAERQQRESGQRGEQQLAEQQRQKEKREGDAARDEVLRCAREADKRALEADFRAQEEANANEMLKGWLKQNGYSHVKSRKGQLFRGKYEYPLHEAAAQSDASTVRLLLRFNADPQQKNSSGLIPQQLAGLQPEVLAALEGLATDL